MGHMLREKENEGGETERERLGESDSNMETWLGERGRVTKKGREREGEVEFPRSDEWIRHRPPSFHLISADGRTWDTHTH